MIRPDQGTLRQVNVRFPARDRERLAIVAHQEQRTLSQLVRWAVDAWLEHQHLGETQARTEQDAPIPLGPHVNVKLPEAIRARLVANSADGTVSTPIRSAVAWWLDATQAPESGRDHTPMAVV